MENFGTDYKMKLKAHILNQVNAFGIFSIFKTYLDKLEIFLFST